MDKTNQDANGKGRSLRKKQEELMAQGVQQAGLAEMLRVYGQFAPYSPAPTASQPVTRFATGGNG